MKKVAIVCDNYKIDKFKTELDKKLIVYTTMVYSVPLKLTLFSIVCVQSQIDIIKNICILCEISLKRSN